MPDRVSRTILPLPSVAVPSRLTRAGNLSSNNQQMTKCLKIMQMTFRRRRGRPQIKADKTAISRTVAAIRARKKAVDRTTSIGRSSRRVKIKIISKRKMRAKPWTKTLTKSRRATKINRKSRNKTKTRMRHLSSRVIIP